MGWGLGWVVAAACGFGLGTVAQGAATMRVPAPGAGADPSSLRRLVRHPLFVLGVGLDALGFLAHVVALRSVSLVLAQSAVAGSLAVTAIAARYLLGTPLRRRDLAAVAAVCVGLGLLAAFSGTAGAAAGTGAVTGGVLLALTAATVVVAVAGLVAAQLAGRYRGAALGLLSGAGFAVCCVAVRLADTSSWGSLLLDPAAGLVAGSGGVGCWLWTLAVQRGSLTAVTAWMVLAEQLPPVVLGPVLFGDTTAPGYAVVVPVVVVLTVAASALLARFSEAAPQPSLEVEAGTSAAAPTAAPRSPARSRRRSR